MIVTLRCEVPDENPDPIGTARASVDVNLRSGHVEEVAIEAKLDEAPRRPQAEHAHRTGKRWDLKGGG